MHGIRGEIQIQIKLELLSDCNMYKKSSTGVQFFSSNSENFYTHDINYLLKRFKNPRMLHFTKHLWIR